MTKSYLKSKKILSIAITTSMMLQYTPMYIFANEAELTSSETVESESVQINPYTEDEVIVPNIEEVVEPKIEEAIEPEGNENKEPDISEEKNIEQELETPETAEEGSIVNIGAESDVIGDAESTYEIVNIPDTNLKAELNNILGQNPTDGIADTQLAGITGVLNLEGKGIKDITGLEYCTSISGLNLNNNEINDISILAGLTNISSLDLGSQNIRGVQTYTGEVENLAKDENGSIIEPNTSSDYEYDVNTNKVKFLNITSTEDRTYTFEKTISLGSATTSFNGEVTHNVNASNYVDIPDDNLREMLNKELGQNATDPIREDQLRGLTGVLRFSGKSIKDIKGLEYCTSVSEIDISNNQIVDISALAGLTSLTSLNLRSNDMVDLSHLSGLTNLTSLDLNHNYIVELGPLSSLINLTNLNLMNNYIYEIDALESLGNLTSLELGINHISDLRPLSGLTNLLDLRLTFNEIYDVSPLKSLTNLTYLNVSNQRLSGPDTETGKVQGIVKDENGNPVSIDNTSDYMYDSATDTIKFLKITNDGNRQYSFNKTVTIGRSSSSYNGYVRHKITNINMISVRVPINAGFQLVNNIIDDDGNVGVEFLSADYKITNNSVKPIKVGVGGFIEKSGNTLDLVNPDEKNWDNLNPQDSMKYIAVGLFDKGGFENSTTTESDPIWLTDKTISSDLGNIVGEGGDGTFTFTSKHSKNLTDSTKATQGKFDLKLKIEIIK